MIKTKTKRRRPLLEKVKVALEERVKKICDVSRREAERAAVNDDLAEDREWYAACTRVES